MKKMNIFKDVLEGDHTKKMNDIGVRMNEENMYDIKDIRINKQAIHLYNVIYYSS